MNSTAQCGHLNDNLAQRKCFFVYNASSRDFDRVFFRPQSP